MKASLSYFLFGIGLFALSSFRGILILFAIPAVLSWFVALTEFLDETGLLERLMNVLRKIRNWKAWRF